ncbi:FliH/SctL family protein [Trichloromonas sp.]|uniref:FliH/SctL family protein n=1 Tax=Trichloromonas sp. TaxID=3069249 RepID=UPI002A3AF37A|nr:FliH/SctL family protein [Trichloromonas sp.]
MSWSRIYKGNECSDLQRLVFADFAGGDGGMVPGGAVFREAVAAAPAAAADGARVHAPAGPSRESEAQAAEAYARGKREGAEEMEKRLGPTIQAFASAVEELSRLRESILKNSSDDMLRLVLAIAEQIIPCAVSLNPEIIHHTIVKALQAAADADSYHIKVHPDDMAVVMEKKPLLMASISGLKNLTVEEDSAIARGGCLVESELGQVDATIESQLDEIREKILRAAGGG